MKLYVVIETYYDEGHFPIRSIKAIHISKKKANEHKEALIVLAPYGTDIDYPFEYSIEEHNLCSDCD